MTKRVFLVVILALALAAAGCGGSDSSDDAGTTTPSTAPSVDDADSGNGTGGQANDGSGGEPTGEPIGPAAMDTIRIGSETWTRTLPMTSGQCFLYEDDGTLPTTGVAWGPLDGPDGIRFSATHNQDGTFEAEVSNDTNVYWFAGPRSPGVDDLVIELDFDALTITGSGTFTSVLGDVAQGSFAFQCDPADQ
jgi:hypothetical protein